jgi:hypothetical protein
LKPSYLGDEGNWVCFQARVCVQIHGHWYVHRKEYLCFSLVLLSTESMNMYNNALVFCSWKSTPLKKEGHLTFEATFDTCSSYLECATI